MLITEPSALKSLDSEKIVIKPSPSTIEYLSKARWSDRLPKVIQAKLVETFENTGRAKAVGKPGDGLLIDYQIVSDLRAFELDLVTDTAKVALSVKLISDKSGRINRARIFTATITAFGNSNQEIIDSLDAAFDAVAVELVAWVLKAV